MNFYLFSYFLQLQLSWCSFSVFFFRGVSCGGKRLKLRETREEKCHKIRVRGKINENALKENPDGFRRSCKLRI